MRRLADTNTMRDTEILLMLWSCFVVISVLIVYCAPSPDVSAIADQVVLNLDGRGNSSFSAERPVCSRVSWETFELVKEAEKKIKRDYNNRLQHQTQVLKEEIENNTFKLWESLNDTKEEFQRKAKDTITEEQLASMIDEAMSRVLERFELRLQGAVDILTKRQDEMDQRLALEPQVMEIRGFMKTDTFVRILLMLGVLAAVMVGLSRLLHRPPAEVPAPVPVRNPAN